MSCLYGDYYGFDPESDADAALKFSLECLLSDDRIASLIRLMTDTHEVAVLEGDPGFFVQRRDRNDANSRMQSASWPEGAEFRAQVGPDAYALGFPEFFVSMSGFCEYLREGLIVYVERSTDPSDAKKLLDMISR